MPVYKIARNLIDGYSPEDQAILEAAFERNPKPDKASRMALVDRVALGEKEVQVHEQRPVISDVGV